MSGYRLLLVAAAILATFCGSVVLGKSLENSDERESEVGEAPVPMTELPFQQVVYIENMELPSASVVPDMPPVEGENHSFIVRPRSVYCRLVVEQVDEANSLEQPSVDGEGLISERVIVVPLKNSFCKDILGQLEDRSEEVAKAETLLSEEMVSPASLVVPVDGEERNRDRDRNRDKDKVVIVPPQNNQPSWVPQCRGKNEVWSSTVQCDVRCDFEGDDDDYRADSDYGYGGSYSRPWFRHLGCYRSVSDVLSEEGNTSVITREAIGFPPESKEEYEARSIDIDIIQRIRSSIGNKNDDGNIIVLETGQPPYRPPPGRCICRHGYARLNGRCVRYGYCPRKYSFTDKSTVQGLECD